MFLATSESIAQNIIACQYPTQRNIFPVKRKGSLMAFKDNLKARREELGMTQLELSKAAGITTRTIYNYESGERRPSNIEVVQKIANALDTSVEKLLSNGETLVIEAHERGGARAAKDINELVSEVTGMFAGGKLSDDALDGAMRALNEAYWIAKDKNKKYGRKKKKDAEEA